MKIYRFGLCSVRSERVKMPSQRAMNSVKHPQIDRETRIYLAFPQVLVTVTKYCFPKNQIYCQLIQNHIALKLYGKIYFMLYRLSVAMITKINKSIIKIARVILFLFLPS